MGIFDRIKGIIWSKPKDEKYAKEYKAAIVKVMKEYGKENLPIIFNMNFGHTEPKICIPYGAEAKINCNEKSFSIIESAVL